MCKYKFYSFLSFLFLSKRNEGTIFYDQLFSYVTLPIKIKSMLNGGQTWTSNRSAQKQSFWGKGKESNHHQICYHILKPYKYSRNHMLISFGKCVILLLNIITLLNELKSDLQLLSSLISGLHPLLFPATAHMPLLTLSVCVCVCVCVHTHTFVCAYYSRSLHWLGRSPTHSLTQSENR